MTSLCPQCGAALPEGTLQGLCPRCVARQAAGILAARLLPDPGSAPPPLSGSSLNPQPSTHVRYFGDYELLEEIARGGMGVVYRARQFSLNRPVALKMILAGQLATLTLKQRFHTEAEAAARLDHPHIVPIYEIGEHEGQYYFSMKLIEGGTLAESILRRRRRQEFQISFPGRREKKSETPDVVSYTEEETAHLIATIARAVHYAHQRGILHRDLKPTNILLDAKGEPHVTDFGLAKLVEEDSSLTMSVAILGTPAYMSPEQAAGRSKGLTTAADIYSLGAVLYELLTGQPPFVGDTPLEIMRKVVEEEPTAPSMVFRKVGDTAPSSRWQIANRKSQIDRDLETICLKCLSKDPQRRYGSAEMLAEDLDRWCKSEPILARPSTTWERTRRWTKRNPEIAALAAGLVLAISAGLLATGFMWHRARQTAGSAQQLFYVASMNRAQAAYEQNNLGLVRQLLEQTENSPLRGFEWYYWQRLAHQELRTFRGHSGAVAGVAVSPDGQRIVSGSIDRTAKVWELATGRELLTLEGHTNVVFSVVFSHDGLRILTGSFDQTVRMWDAVTGRELLRLDGHSREVDTVAFSRDDRRILTGSADNTVRLWDATTGRELRRLPGHLAALSPDERQIASTGGFVLVGNVLSVEASKIVTLWDVESGRELRQLKGHSEGIASVAFSPDGQHILTGGYDNTAKVWDAATGTNLLTLRGHLLKIEPAAFSWDGKRTVTASADQTAKVWDAESGRELFTLKGHSGTVNWAAFCPDNRLIVTTSHDKTVKLWDSEAIREAITLDGQNPKLTGLAFSPDGKRMVTGSYTGQGKVWDATTGQVLYTIAATSVAFSPDGRQIVATHYDSPLRCAELFDAETGRQLTKFPVHKEIIEAVAFSPDGQRIVTSSDDMTAAVWDVRSGKELLRLIGHTGGVRRVSFSPDGQRIVTASTDGTARIWNAATGAELSCFKGHRGAELFGVTFSPDGQRVLSGDENGSGLLWETATGEVLLTLKGHTALILCITFSPDGRRILTGSQDSTAKLWEAATGQELLTFKGHQGDVPAARFSPDGRRIATAGSDGLVKLWDVATPGQVRAWQEEERAAAKGIEGSRREQASEH